MLLPFAGLLTIPTDTTLTSFTPRIVTPYKAQMGCIIRITKTGRKNMYKVTSCTGGISFFSYPAQERRRQTLFHHYSQQPSHREMVEYRLVLCHCTLDQAQSPAHSLYLLSGATDGAMVDFYGMIAMKSP